MAEANWNNEQLDFLKVLPHEKHLFNKKHGAARLVFLLLYKWFARHAYFPEDIGAFPEECIRDIIKREAPSTTQADLQEFFTNRRTITRYQKEIRRYLQFKPFDANCTLLQDYLASHVFRTPNEERLKLNLHYQLKQNRMEIPSECKLLEVIRKAKITTEQKTFTEINVLLSDEDRYYIDNQLMASSDNANICQFLRQDSGASTHENIKAEMERLHLLEQLPIAALKKCMDSINPRQRNIYRRRFLTDTPQRFKRRAANIRYALAIIFCYQRHTEAVDNLIEHLLHFIHQIKKFADHRHNRLSREVGKRLDDLEVLYQLAQINHDQPKDIIEQAVYPSIPQEVIKEVIDAREAARQLKDKVRSAVLKRYSLSYRSIIFTILNGLEFNSSSSIFLNAIELLQEYQYSKLQYYPTNIDIPITGVLSKQQQKNIERQDEEGNPLFLRKEYECAILKQLRLKLRHKEVWVSGAYKYRNPVEDEPEAFKEKRQEYFALLDAPLLSTEFTAKLKEKMRYHLNEFDRNLPNNNEVCIIKKKGKPWIKLTPLTKVEEPKAIQKLKETVFTKWGMIDLLDIIKEVDLHENFTKCFGTAGDREILDREIIRKRLIFCNFAIGTNTGLKRAAGASKGAVTFEELRHIKKFYFSKDDLREAINKVINRIFEIRNPQIWNSVSTACAGDSKQFGCFNNNLLSEWSPRHHNDGVMIYWHVSDQYICVYSQLKTCTSSEVASMFQGINDQKTDMEIKSQYVDSHGQSELGFALSYLEKFDLLPRYKTIGNQKLYLPDKDFTVKNVGEIIARVIDFKLIEEQYEEMIKHAVALKIGTATAETIIRKFARSNYQHTTFKAFMELGKAVKTIFLCRFLDSIALRQQINAGLNVVENWNSANNFVYYGKSGEITSNSRDDQEISMLCLHLLQTCILYINTLLIEELLLDSSWREKLKAADYRGLSGT